MKIFFVVLFVIIMIVLVMVFVGRSLPVKHTASLSATFTSPPEEVWKVVVNVAELKSWRKDVKDVTITGLDTFKETGSNGEIEYRVSNSVPGVSHVATIITKDIPFGGQWNYVFEKEAGGCKLTITENGEVYNPLFRFMSKYIFGHDGTLKGYMKDLQERVN